MSFKPDPNKQAQEVIFRKVAKNLRHPPPIVDHTKVSQSATEKH